MSKREPFVLSGVTVEPGTSRTIHIPLTLLPNNRPFTLDVRVIHGHKPGKCLFISSTIHGDELNGIESIRRILASPILKHIHGTLIAIPMVNMIGALIESRYLPDRRDLNRSFPGSPTGSSASQLANTFLNEVVKNCTHGIDLHTGSNHRTNLPQVRCDFDNEFTIEMAKAFGAPVILKAGLRDGSLREACESLGIPTLIYEAGEAFRFNEFAIRTATQGIIRIMCMLGMISQKKYHSPKRTPIIATKSLWLRSPITGLFRNKCHLGQKVIKGEILGHVSDPFGSSTEAVVANMSGIVLGKTLLPLAYKGDALFNVGWVDDPHLAEERIEEIGEDIETSYALDDPLTY